MADTLQYHWKLPLLFKGLGGEVAQIQLCRAGKKFTRQWKCSCLYESCSPYKVFSIFFPINSPDIAGISFLKLRKVKVKSISHIRLFAPWTVACTRLLHPWDYVAKSTGVGCHFLLQGIFPTQGSNPGLPHCRQTLYHLSHPSTDTGSESHTHNRLAPTSKMSFHGKNS